MNEFINQRVCVACHRECCGLGIEHEMSIALFDISILEYKLSPNKKNQNDLKKFVNIPREKERTMKSITIELIHDWKFRFQIIHHINWQLIMLCIRSHVVALSSLFFSSLQCLGNSLSVVFWCRAFTDDVVVNFNILRKSIACLICVWVFQWFVLKAVPHRNYCISNV